jgi:hypothetical protein
VIKVIKLRLILNFFQRCEVNIFGKQTTHGQLQIDFTYSQVHFVTSQSQYCPILKYLFPSQHSQASNSTIQGNITKSKFILQTIKWTSSCPQNLIFLVCPMLEFILWFVKTSTPKNQIDVYSFIIQVQHGWPYSPFLLWNLFFFFFDLMVFWSLIVALSKFKLL